MVGKKQPKDFCATQMVRPGGFLDSTPEEITLFFFFLGGIPT